MESDPTSLRSPLADVNIINIAAREVGRGPTLSAGAQHKNDLIAASDCGPLRRVLINFNYSDNRS